MKNSASWGIGVLAIAAWAGASNAGLNDPLLELRSWHWGRSSGGDFVKAEGEVANIVAWPLDRVEVVVTWTAKDGTLITSASALIQYNPVLPDQRSPFKVMAPWNPAMVGATIDFKMLGGPQLRWRERPAMKK